MSLKSKLYSVYKKFNDSAVVATLSHFYYLKIKKNRFDDKAEYEKESNPGLPKIAIVCDEMTYWNFKEFCNLRFVRPDNWKKVLKEFKPEIFLCESAWCGIDAYPDCWRCRIYRNHRVLFENRKELLEILAYCKQNGIKTVFWNKEDPTFFGNKQYDYIDTALKFDHIFTTCAECVEKYKALGAKNVQPLMFGFSPALFNDKKMSRKENCAVFAGSWYADAPERCRDMEKLFDMILDKGIELRIYDRHYGINNANFTFPEKYQPFVHPAVPYNKINEIFKDVRYAVNINTVKDSSTMFARRVFELMACGKCIISNESKGMREIFGDGVWFAGEDFDFDHLDEICERNKETVLREHSFKARVEQIINSL
ncbi:MAG: glycosyltransferase [Clostridia bacterium]|nr:glycosyltransferase [Clostridia bacterium]